MERGKFNIARKGKQGAQHFKFSYVTIVVVEVQGVDVCLGGKAMGLFSDKNAYVAGAAGVAIRDHRGRSNVRGAPWCVVGNSSYPPIFGGP